jgi:hypothetical protein
VPTIECRGFFCFVYYSAKIEEETEALGADKKLNRKQYLSGPQVFSSLISINFSLQLTVDVEAESYE